MWSPDALLKRLVLSRLDKAALALAILLSLACLTRGAVYDALIALLLLATLPILFVALGSQEPVHAALKKAGLLLLAGLGIILCLQQLVPGSTALWHPVPLITMQPARTVALVDKAAWWQGVGRLMWFAIIFTVALFIGSNRTSARLFFRALMVSGSLCIALTFFFPGDSDTPAHTYTHGFVNANNAASYLGVMLLVALAQCAHFFHYSDKPFHRLVIDFLDQINIPTILQGSFLLFAVLLSLAGLFTTGSRGGMLASLVCSFFFIILILLKMALPMRLRRVLVLSTTGVLGLLMLWSFLNFGQALSDKLHSDPDSFRSRRAIYAAVPAMIGDRPLLGSGLASFPSAFKPYRPPSVSSDGIIDKAHNSYLEFAAEMGMPAFLLLMGVLGWMGWQLLRCIVIRKANYTMPALGLSVMLLAALHSLVDFPLQIPGIAALCIAITTICVAQTEARFDTAASPPKRKRIRKRRRAKSI